MQKFINHSRILSKTRHWQDTAGLFFAEWRDTLLVDKMSVVLGDYTPFVLNLKSRFGLQKKDTRTWGTSLPLLPDVRTVEVQLGPWHKVMLLLGITVRESRNLKVETLGRNHRSNRYLRWKYRTLILAAGGTFKATKKIKKIGKSGKIYEKVVEESLHWDWNPELVLHWDKASLFCNVHDMSRDVNQPKNYSPEIFWKTAWNLMNHCTPWIICALRRIDINWDSKWHLTKIEKMLCDYYRILDRKDNYMEKKRFWIQSPPGRLRPLTIPTLPWRLYSAQMALFLDIWLRKTLPPNQHAYTYGRGTMTAWKQILNELIIQRPLTALFEFDLEKFFSTIDLNKLKGRLEIIGTPQWVTHSLITQIKNPPEQVEQPDGLIRDYVHKSPPVKTNWSELFADSSSKLENSNFGVSMGTAYSPLLAIFALNDWYHALKWKGINLFMYADDGIIEIGDKSTEKDFWDCENHLKAWGIRISRKKSGWLRQKGGKWLKALKFLGLIYKPEEDTLYSKTRSGHEVPLKLGIVFGHKKDVPKTEWSYDPIWKKWLDPRLIHYLQHKEPEPDTLRKAKHQQFLDFHLPDKYHVGELRDITISEMMNNYNYVAPLLLILLFSFLLSLFPLFNFWYILTTILIYYLTLLHNLTEDWVWKTSQINWRNTVNTGLFGFCLSRIFGGSWDLKVEQDFKVKTRPGSLRFELMFGLEQSEREHVMRGASLNFMNITSYTSFLATSYIHSLRTFITCNKSYPTFFKENFFKNRRLAGVKPWKFNHKRTWHEGVTRDYFDQMRADLHYEAQRICIVAYVTGYDLAYIMNYWIQWTLKNNPRFDFPSRCFGTMPWEQINRTYWENLTPKKIKGGRRWPLRTIRDHLWHTHPIELIGMCLKAFQEEPSSLLLGWFHTRFTSKIRGREDHIADFLIWWHKQTAKKKMDVKKRGKIEKYLHPTDWPYSENMEYKIMSPQDMRDFYTMIMQGNSSKPEFYVSTEEGANYLRNVIKHWDMDVDFYEPPTKKMTKYTA